MGITATNQTQERELTPAGNHVARCYSMIHIGTVEEEYMGDVKMMNKARITWELPTELRVFKEENGEQPMVISKEYTLSLGDKANLRKDLDSWRGKALTDEEASKFDITRLIGVPCMLNVIHKASKMGKMYATISAISPMPKGLSCPKQINETFIFDYEENYSDEKIASFPDFIKDKIKSSVEYRKRNGTYVDLPPTEHADFDGHDDRPESDLPF